VEHSVKAKCIEISLEVGEMIDARSCLNDHGVSLPKSNQ
jgi:hypothetical protein